MTMLRVLLAKDLLRAWRNPLPWLINLIIPLSFTALIGFAFGGKPDSGALGRIRFAVVDEDKTLLSDFLRGAANQREGGKHLEPVFMDRDAAMREIMANKISAVLIIPEHFTRNYLTGGEAVSLELIKNPAQSIHPAVLEELLGAVVTALNALARNFQPEFPQWEAVIEGKADPHQVAALIEREGNTLEGLKRYVNPPLVSYEKEVRPGEKAQSGPVFNLFGYLLAGMAAMFLLFIGGNAMTDMHREVRFRTFERYHTLHQQLMPFLLSKGVFTTVLLLACSMILLGGGALLFRIHWDQPIGLAALTFAYACCAASIMAVAVAVMNTERYADVLTNSLTMFLGLAGGCMFPPQQFPAFLREHITPLLPTYWYSESVRNLAYAGTLPWALASLKLLALSAVLIALAVVRFQYRFRTGLRA
jgi:ABC-2 type transport system permease protein